MQDLIWFKVNLIGEALCMVDVYSKLSKLLRLHKHVNKHMYDCKDLIKIKNNVYGCFIW